MNLYPWLALLLLLPTAFAADVVDRTFRPNARPIVGGPDGPVLAMAHGPGDTILIAGDFLRLNGILRASLARLKQDGSPDETFQPGSGADGLVRSLLVENDGAVLLAGDFSRWNGVPVNEPLIRLHANGSVDPGFGGADSGVERFQQLVRLPSGAFLAWGWETNTGVSRTFLQKRLSSGAVDPTFNLTLPDTTVLYSVAADDSGAVWIAGKFTEFQGVARTNLVRLTPALEVDLAWESPSAAVATELRAVAVGADGRVAIGGSKTNPFSLGYLAVLLPNGQPDPNFATIAYLGPWIERITFTATGGLAMITGSLNDWTMPVLLSATGVESRVPAEGLVEGAAPLSGPDGRILWPTSGVDLVGGTVRSWLWRSLPDGSLDDSFNREATLDSVIPYPSSALAVFQNGDVATRGRTGLVTNSTTGATGFLNHLERLDASGERKIGFEAHDQAGTGINDLKTFPDGRLLIAGSFSRVNWDPGSPMVAILREDGSRDNSFASSLRTFPDANNWWIVQAEIQLDGKIVIGGRFSHPQLIGSSGHLLHRLLPTGAVDPNFKPLTATSGSVGRFLPLGSDQFLVWGQVSSQGPALFVYSAHGTSNAAPVISRANGRPTVSAMVRLPDGGILLGGRFDQVGGLPRAGLVRLRPDLAVDPDFAPVRQINGAVQSVAPLQDGRILVGGSFTQWDGNPARRLMLLDAQGRPDPAWSSGTGPDDAVLKLIELPNGQVLVGGIFGSFDGGGPSRLLRLTIPPSVPVPSRILQQPRSLIVTELGNTQVLEVAIQGTPPLQVRWFRNGVALPETNGVFEAGVAKLILSPSVLAEPATYHCEVSNTFGRERSVNVLAGVASGTLDPSFTTNLVNREMRLRVPSSVSRPVTGLFGFHDASGRTQRILVVGNFTQYDRELLPGLALLQPDGARDTTWNPPAGLSGGMVVAAEFLPDRSVYLAGRFTRANGAPRDVVLRLKPDGSLDESFDPGDELTVAPPLGFPRQSQVASLAVDADGVFLASAPGSGGPNGFVRRLDQTGQTDLNFRATNSIFFGSPTVLALETDPSGGLLVAGTQFGVTRRTQSEPTFRGVARFLFDGRLDLEFNDAPRRPDFSAQGDITALIPRGPTLWVGGTFAEFDRAPGPLVRLDSTGTADTNFVIRFSGTTNSYPRRSLRGAQSLPSGAFLLNFDSIVPATDSVQSLLESGEISGASGGAVDRLRVSGGPVLALNEHSYVTPITLRENIPGGGLGASYQSLGRFSLNVISGSPSPTNTIPPRIASPLSPVDLKTRPGFREPLVLSAVVQVDAAAQYRWYHREILIPGATNSFFILASPRAEDAGEYRLEVENAAGIARTSAVVTVVPAPPDVPRLSSEWVGGERPVRIRFSPAPGLNVRWESSTDLRSWAPVTDPDVFLSESELAPRVGSGPEYFRLVEAP
ncbi:MAG: hypothetical protein J0M24_02875 [Verrucomicrobia bacterium]|nr:hypothetical protein [Verrucomicrobiota bacterium]